MVGRCVHVVAMVVAACLAPAAWANEPGDSAAHADQVASGHNSAIPYPAGLKTQVEFWKRVFATYSTHQVAIHDTLYLDRTYEVLDFGTLADSGLSDAEIAAYAREKVESEKERIRALLMRLHRQGDDPQTLTFEEQKIAALFAESTDPAKYLHAAADDRLRTQTGLRERFAAGVEISRRYLPAMEATFRRAGLPLELTRLPLVESCFNVRAYSKVGAAGIWQFMPSTGRLFMRIDRAVDERRDPIASTEAAADFLKANYDVLGTWPLAITAYNHGRAGMVRAVADVGSNDIVEIIQHYHGPAFKFASRNFYAEFLAAVEVERNFESYFGPLSPQKPLRTDKVAVPDTISLRTLARAVDADTDTLAEFNPALTREVISGRLPVPRGYTLHLPPGSAGRFRVHYASLAAAEKAKIQLAMAHRKSRARVQKAAYVTHRVQRGQTLATIAKKYRTSVGAIRTRNRLHTNPRLRAGQSLIIPTT